MSESDNTSTKIGDADETDLFKRIARIKDEITELGAEALRVRDQHRDQLDILTGRKTVVATTVVAPAGAVTPAAIEPQSAAGPTGLRFELTSESAPTLTPVNELTALRDLPVSEPSPWPTQEQIAAHKASREASRGSLAFGSVPAPASAPASAARLEIDTYALAGWHYAKIEELGLECSDATREGALHGAKLAALRFMAADVEEGKDSIAHRFFVVTDADRSVK